MNHDVQYARRLAADRKRVSATLLRGSSRARSRRRLDQDLPTSVNVTQMPDIRRFSNDNSPCAKMQRDAPTLRPNRYSTCWSDPRTVLKTVALPLSSRAGLVSVIALGSFIAAGVMARPYVHGLSFVIRAADLHGVMRLAADLDAESVRERDLTIPLPTGSTRRVNAQE